MLHSIKFISSPTQFLHKNTQKPLELAPETHGILKQCSKYSRRELAIFTKSSLILLLTSQTLDPISLPNARADENRLLEPETDPQRSSVSICIDKNVPTRRAFLDISVDGEPIGRIVIGLYEQNAPVGATRFIDLVTGKAGISLRRKEFTRIMPNYVQHGGVRSYGVDAELANRAGRNLTNEKLSEELERFSSECEGTKNVSGSVGIIVRNPAKPPPKMKLVARKGKLEIDQEEVGVEPNGTEFTIAMRDSPELDSSALVVGKVLEGMDVVEKIGMVKTVQENTSSPYFRVAKLIGDKRAVVAERGFNRPYSKVIVTNCGMLD